MPHTDSSLLLMFPKLYLPLVQRQLLLLFYLTFYSDKYSEFKNISFSIQWICGRFEQTLSTILICGPDGHCPEAARA